MFEGKWGCIAGMIIFLGFSSCTAIVSIHETNLEKEKLKYKYECKEIKP